MNAAHHNTEGAELQPYEDLAGCRAIAIGFFGGLAVFAVIGAWVWLS